MDYQAELDLQKKIFKKYRLQIKTVNPQHGIKQVSEVKENIVYRLSDIFSCSYIFLRLPVTSDENVLLIGPYLTEEPSQEKLLKHAEAMKLSPSQTRDMETYYKTIPLLNDSGHILAVLDAFAETIWGGSGNYTVQTIEKDSLGSMALHLEERVPQEIDQTLWNMEVMERRYSYENDLMYAISHGQEYKASIMFTSFSKAPFDKRSADPLRNTKNHLIIMNTLCRKAAEQGGVHPLYLNELSSSFAQKIEQLPEAPNLQEFMRSMFKSYCRLVKKHSFKNFSPLIKKILVYVDSDLTADLSLHALAKLSGVSDSYLSSQFHQETGRTLTDYVSEKRVNHASWLLETSSLQIQTIAQHCGFMDVHYFSKVFKKYTGKTPKEYRNSLNNDR